MFKSLPPEKSWNSVKAVLQKDISLLSMVTHGATHLMHRYQQRGECLQEFIFEFSKHIKAITNWKPKDITDPLKIYMYTQKMFNPAISATTTKHAHPTLQKVID